MKIATKIRAKFMFVDGADHIHLEWVGTKDWALKKAEPQHISRWPAEWQAYQAVKPKTDHGGTPLSEIPGLQPKDSVALSMKGIHNVEALANIDEYTAATMDAGNGVTWHRIAKMVIAAKGVADKAGPMTLQKKAA
jgi:hypothetical protein